MKPCRRKAAQRLELAAAKAEQRRGAPSGPLLAAASRGGWEQGCRPREGGAFALGGVAACPPRLLHV